MPQYIETATEALVFLQQHGFDHAASALSAAQCAVGVPDAPDRLRLFAQQASQIADLIETEKEADAFDYRLAKAQAAAWFKFTEVLALHNEDTFLAPGTGEQCTVNEILRLQKCETDLKGLRKQIIDLGLGAGLRS